MPGDVIIQIGQYPVNSPDDLGAALGALAGTQTTLTFIRNSIEQVVIVKLNPIPLVSQPTGKG
jgi:S1-C subfamily serine protease